MILSDIIISEGNRISKKAVRQKKGMVLYMLDVENAKIMVDLLNESYKRKLQYKQRYEHCHDTAGKKIYRDAYLKALDLYSARYQMLLLFGYDVVFDENNNIIGIKKFKE